MTDRENVVGAVHAARNEIEDICHERSECAGCPAEEDRLRCKAGYIVNKLIADGMTVQRWIPVSERMPDNRDIVVVVNRRRTKMLASWDRISWMFHGIHGSDDYLCPITHWTPLPRDPIKEEK